MPRMLRIYFGLAGSARCFWWWWACSFFRLPACWDSGDVAFRRRLHCNDGGHDPDAAVQSGVRAISRARPVWSRGLAAERRHAGRSAGATDSDRRKRKSVGGHHSIRLGSAAAARLSRSDRRAAPVSVFARRARTSIVALERRSVSLGISIRRGRRHGNSFALRARPAGQRPRFRSRCGCPMGPHAHHRGGTAGAMLPDDASARGRAWSRLRRRFEGAVAEPLCPRLGVRLSCWRA